MSEDFARLVNRAAPYAKPAVAIVIALCAVAYAAAIVFGWIEKEQRIDGTSGALIAVALLVALLVWNPKAFDRIRLLQILNFKLQLSELKSRQDSMEMILPLLIPEHESRHLRNLLRSRTASYRGTRPMREELRRLRAMSLIEMKGDRHVGDMKDGHRFDLSNFVELTPLGRECAQRLQDFEDAERARRAQNREGGEASPGNDLDPPEA
jgi:hypothetical protein